MEVFKYVTAKHFEHIKLKGRIDPRLADYWTYGIPEDPFLWGEHLKGITTYLEKYAGVSPLLLLKFVIDENDPEAFVQEGDEYVWNKFKTRKPLVDYKREDYRLPEVIIGRSIPIEKITLLENPSIPDSK